MNATSAGLQNTRTNVWYAGKSSVTHAPLLIRINLSLSRDNGRKTMTSAETASLQVSLRAELSSEPCMGMYVLLLIYTKNDFSHHLDMKRYLT